MILMRKNFLIIAVTMVLLQFDLHSVAQAPIKANLDGTIDVYNGSGFIFENNEFKAKYFELSKAILFNCKSESNKPVTRFKIPQLATSIDFTHTMNPGTCVEDWNVAVGLSRRKLDLPPDYPVLFYYEVFYEDSSKIEIPVRYKESIDDWYRVNTISPALWCEAKHQHDINPETGEKAVLYTFNWINPLPEKRIIGISIKNDLTPKTEKVLIFDVSIRQEKTGKLYFVNRTPMGKDTNPGTYSKPFGSLNRAIRVAKPGDFVFIRGGYYSLNEPVDVEMTKSETNNWLTISSWIGETPVLDAFGIHYNSEYIGNKENKIYEQNNGVINITGNPFNLRIQGIHIYNSRKAGISIYGESEIIRENGKYIGTIQGESKNIDIRFNTIFHTNSMGIITHNTNDVTITGNRVIRPHSAQMSSDKMTGKIISFDHGAQEAIDLTRNRNVEIAFNEVLGGRKEAIDLIRVEQAKVHHNYVNSCLNGIYIDSWNIPMRDIEIYNNYLYNVFHAIPTATEGSGDLFDVSIHNNLIINSKNKGIAVTEAVYKSKPAKVQNNKIFNNTIFKYGGHAKANGWSYSGITVRGFKDNPDFKNVLIEKNIIAGTTENHFENSYSLNDEHNIQYTGNIEETCAGYNFEGKSLKGNKIFVNPENGDFRINPEFYRLNESVGLDAIGAIPSKTHWQAGRDWSGKITESYYGALNWCQVFISTGKFNLYRNNLMRPSWFQRNRYGTDFDNLPAGMQSFAGVTFYIPNENQSGLPSVISLKGAGNECQEDSVTGIELHQKVSHLAFLQNYHFFSDVMKEGDFEKVKSAPGTILFAYIVKYSSGNRIEIPVKLCKDVDDWLCTSSLGLKNLSNARLAWWQPVSKRNGTDEYLRLFSFVWENPYPEMPIESISLINKQNYEAGAPAVFGISYVKSNN